MICKETISVIFAATLIALAIFFYPYRETAVVEDAAKQQVANNKGRICFYDPITGKQECDTNATTTNAIH